LASLRETFSVPIFGEYVINDITLQQEKFIMRMVQ